MSPVRLVAALLAVLMLAPAAMTLNPFDDDAGSGGDAGDEPEDATPIGFGQHSGMLTPGIDREDWYVLELEAGTYLEVNWAPASDDTHVRLALFGPGPDGDPMVPIKRDSHGNLFHTVPTNGTWFLRIFLEADPAPFHLVAYNFHVSGTTHPSFFTTATPSPSYVVEATFDKAYPFTFSVRQDLHEYSTTRAGEMGFLLEWELDKGDEYGFQNQGIAVWGSKNQYPDRIETAGLLPSTEVPVLIQTESGVDRNQFSVAFTNISGWLRLYSFHAYDAVWTEIVASSGGAMAAGGSEGGTVTSWTTKDLIDGDDLLLPAYARTDGGALEVDIEGPYAGAFLPRANPGRATAPSGTIYESGAQFQHNLWFLHPAMGTWTFELDETERISVAPDQAFFIGASFPHLGIAPEPETRCPLGIC